MSQGLEPSQYDKCLYFGHDVIVVTYVDDCLFFSKSGASIGALNSSLQQPNPATGKPDFRLEVEGSSEKDDSVFAFLGVSLLMDDKGNNKIITLKQTGLIEKILWVTGMTECNPNATPLLKKPLGTDAKGAPCKHSWDYVQVVGMLMYLCSNARPDIQFAVHQCARFTHSPRHSHEQAILRICRYLKGTSTQGMTFKTKRNGIPHLDLYCDADFAGLWNTEDHQDPACVKS